MIDIHCHILPGVDDGSSDMEESIAMARQAISDGIHTIIASPHTLNGIYFNSIQEVTSQLISVRGRFISEKLLLNLCPGTDTHLCKRLTEFIHAGEAVTINNAGKYLLLEFPHQSIPSWYREEIFQLKLKGITPIITHPERNLIFQEKIDMIYELVNMGCLIQVTAMSILGGFGEEAMDCSHLLLKYQLAHIIASDAHSSAHRPPILSSAVEAASHIIGDEKAAISMVTHIPEAIIAGNTVDIPKPLKPNRKSWFNKFWST